MPQHVGYGRKVGDGGDSENMQNTDELGRFASGSVNPKSERTANGENDKPKREDFHSLDEYMRAILAWRQGQKKKIEEPIVEPEPEPEPIPEPEPVVEPVAEPEPEPKSDNDLYRFFEENDVTNLAQWEAKQKADNLTNELAAEGRLTFAKNFENFADERIRLACLLSLKKVTNDFDISQSLGVIDIRTHKNRYYGDTKVVYKTSLATGKRNYKASWIIISSGERESGYSLFLSLLSASGKWKGMAGATMQQFQGRYYQDQQSGFHDECSDLYALHSVMIHEYGHNVQYDIANKLFNSGQTSSLEEGTTKINEQIMAKALEMFPEEYNNDIAAVRKDASRYGGKNSREWFAENFASMYSDRPRKSALAMREVLKLYF